MWGEVAPAAEGAGGDEGVFVGGPVGAGGFAGDTEGAAPGLHSWGGVAGEGGDLPVDAPGSAADADCFARGFPGGA